MVKTLRAFFLSFTILAFLLFSTIGTTTVYADDGTGTETSETVVTTSEEEQPSEPQAGEEPPAGDEEQPSAGENEETPPTGDEGQPVEETVTEEPVETTILEQVPDNTTVTVLNSEGEALPLVSQEAADIIVSGTDPVWCPDGKIPGDAECTAEFLSFTALLQELEDNPVTYQGAGTIFIEQGLYGGSETVIDFNSYNLSGIKDSALTLQGGWDPADNSTDSTSTFEIPIIIGSSTSLWGGSLTINNINITGVADQTGLTIHTEDVINLNNVEVTNSQSGINLNAGKEISLIDVNASNNKTYGAYIKGKDVAIDTANFSNNTSGDVDNLTGSGLEVISDFEVSLASVIANNNQLYGADVTAGANVAIEKSTFNGQISYGTVPYYYDWVVGEIVSRDGGYGLRVFANGNIAIEEVEANNNYKYGAYLEGKGAEITVEKSFFNNNGSGIVTDPKGYGLQIVGSGSVEVLDVTASNNQYFGADIKATNEDVKVDNDVTVQNSFFSGHQSLLHPGEYYAEFFGYGLKVTTPDDIFLNYVTGNFNNLWGANLIGNEVTVYNSQFNNNVSDTETFIDDTGLFVDAVGDVDIWKVEARDNRLFGASIISDGDVYIADSFFTGNRGITCLDIGCTAGANLYHGIGLQVTTPGYIEVTGTDVSGNRLAGAELNGGVVTVVDSFFNDSDMGNGLTVNATDDVTLTNVTASKNEGNGVEVNGNSCDQIVQVTGGTFLDNLLYGLNVLDATLTFVGTQDFGNNSNGSGDFFASPCVVVTLTASQTTTTTTIPTVDPTVTDESSTTTTDEQTPAPTAPPVDTNLNSVLVTTTNNSDNPEPAPIITTNIKQEKPENPVVQKPVKSHKDKGFKTWIWKFRRAISSSSFFLELEELFRLLGGFSFGKMLMPK